MAARRLQRRLPSAGIGELEGLPPLLARIYAARGVRGMADLDRSLGGLHQPSAMRGLAAASARLANAICAGESVLVVGDYDADGATSSALLLLGLRALGCSDCDFLVPDRFRFGYGLTPGLVEVAAARAPRLIVTVDNGMSSVAGVAAARAHGIDVVVTDHHLAGALLPDANAILNPNQPGCEFPSKHLAGVGVVFYLLGALRTELRQRGWLPRNGSGEPRLADLLDLVALGTVADVVPLDRNNRVLVHQGLLRLRAGRGRPGIRALFEVAGRDWRRAGATDLGFVAGPRLNAAGRLDDMSLGIRCLLEDDPLRAREMAAELDCLNRERRVIEEGMQREALQLLADEAVAGAALPWGLTLFRPEWHQGVVGLVASRLKERHHRPVVAFAPGAAGELRGSARSIHGFHVRDALVAIDAREPGLMLRFGGHAMAAGLSLRPECLPRFAAAFDAEVRATLAPGALEQVLETDGALVPGEFSLEIAAALQDGGPWGQHFPEPLFDGVFRLRAQRIVGERHLKLGVSPVEEPALLIDAIAFGADLGRWPDPAVERARLAFRLDVNEYRGSRALQLVVEHIEACA